MKQLNQKTAIVTEAGKGIGKAIAIYLAGLGVKVVCTGSREASLRKTAAGIKASGGECFYLTCPAGNRARIKEVVGKAVEMYGSVDVVINTMTDTPRYAAVESAEYEDLYNMWLTGTITALYFMQESFPYMKGQGEGCVINFIPGVTKGSENLVCACNKESVRALTKSAAKEWEQYGICVNCVIARENRDNAAPVTAFLSGPDSRFYSGQCLLVEGTEYSVV